MAQANYIELRLIYDKIICIRKIYNNAITTFSLQNKLNNRFGTDITKDIRYSTPPTNLIPSVAQSCTNTDNKIDIPRIINLVIILTNQLFLLIK